MSSHWQKDCLDTAGHHRLHCYEVLGINQTMDVFIRNIIVVSAGLVRLDWARVFKLLNEHYYNIILSVRWLVDQTLQYTFNALLASGDNQ